MVNNLSYLLKIVIHNKINYPLYLDVPVPPEFVAALRTSPITMAEFLISGIGTGGKIIDPKLPIISELNNFRILGNG